MKNLVPSVRTKTIRFRLLFWYTLTFTVSSLIIFTGFYLVTRNVLYARTDDLLRSHAGTITGIVTAERMDMHQMLSRQILSAQFSETPGMLITIMNGSGQVVNASQETRYADTLFAGLYARAKDLGQTFYTNGIIGSSRFRFIVTPVKNTTELEGVVIVGHPIDVIENALRSLFVILSILFLLLIIPTTAVGYLIAGNAMRPIADISEKIRNIGSDNLTERVPDPDTDDEVEELAGSFNSLLDRLGDAFDRERQFISDVAHELKTPLATMRSQIEVTLTKPRTVPEYRSALHETLIDTNRMAATLKNILDLARSSADEETGGRLFDFSGLVAETRETAEKLALSKHVGIDVSQEPGLCVFGKREMLVRAILNLVDNAVKFTPEGGNVFLTLRRQKNYAVFSIRDTGVGIKRADLPHIFKRFYRGGKTSKTFGSGLGLAIARAAVTTHHGTISVTSRPGKGSVFTVRLPLSAPSSKSS
ncbi:HAMP domain-containing histidine kinase [Patescibacteria group bacterium]|nr:HAMP domain-containing histidine kinase [Patescibacteria group bacterium]